MMDDTPEPEKNDLALEISMATFALRAHLSPIQGYGQILKIYLEERQKMDDSSVKIKLAEMEAEITSQLVVQMIDNILKSVGQLYQLQDDLRNKASGFSED